MTVLDNARPTTAAPAGGLAIRLEGVTKRFPGGVQAVDPVNLEIPAGQFLSLLGPSGCGKSTLLRMIAGLETPSAGRIALGGTSAGAPAGRSDLAFVFQDAHLLPWRNVLDNAALPLELRGTDKAGRRAAAAEVLEQVGLGDALHRYPAQLSGGMRMRVSLARALVTSPRLLLLDEPFAALDEITRQSLDEQLRDVWATRGMTVLFVTHSIMEAAFLAERAVVLSRRPATIVLDHALQLPASRSAGLRGEPEFARQMRVLLTALRDGEPR